MSRYKIITSSSAEEWDRAILQLPVELQDVHLTARYHHLYERNGDGDARLFVYEKDGQHYLLPFLLRPIPPSLSAGGFFDIESAYGYAGPVSTSTDPEFLKAADNAFLDYCREQKVVTEFIRYHPLLSNQRFVVEGQQLELIHLRDYVAVALSGTADTRWNEYSPQNRNKIRKAEKAGYGIFLDITAEKFNEFVRIYLENMRQLKAVKQYYFSPAYFESLRQLVLSDGTLLLVMKENRVEGAAVFLGYGRYAHYFLSSVTPEGRRNGVGNLLLHEGINWAAEKKYEVMHLGGGLTADSNDPLLVFKQNFSRKTLPFYIGKRIHDAGIYQQLIAAWEFLYPEAKGKFSAILQRYRWTKEDLPEVH